MRWLIGFLLCSFALFSYANTHAITENAAEQERVYLVQLANQLNATIPIIRAAEKSQPNNKRVRFHYSAWRDAKGQKYNGLLEDIQAIRKGVEENLNTTSIEPRSVEPISGDYLGQY